MATVRPVEVLLLGTGGSRGWPEPGCTCASCSLAVRSRTARAPDSAVVDGVLLLDGYDGVERAAARAGRDLHGVRQVLLRGPQVHPAHWLDTVGGAAPVQVLGSAAALADLGTSAERFQLLPVRPGEEYPTVAGHRVRAVPQGEGLAWSVVGPAGDRLLHAAAAAEVDAAPVPAPYDLVLLGLGSRSTGGAVLAQLRRDGAVGRSTDVRALGYGHDSEPPDVLQHLLGEWGVGGTRDGDVLLTTPSAPEQPEPSGRTLVLGGVRSGKSALAEQLLAAHPQVTYVATGGTRTGDAEWQQRVELHRTRRPASWSTVETTELTSCLRCADGALLIDCLGTWLTALLDQHRVWEGGSLAPVEAAVEELLVAWRASCFPLVAVSNEVGSGVVPATPSGRLFRDLLGRLNARVAAESETVLLTVAGVPLPLRAVPRG